jgi:hypothetical protein
MIAGRFKSAFITPFQAGYMGEGTKFRLKVEFSYVVEGYAYSGKYARDFLIEDEAIGLWRSLQQGSLYVRCNPASPADYVFDPYRDAWQPAGSDSTSSMAASVERTALGSTDIQWKRIGQVNWWTSPVSLGKLFSFQAAAAVVLFLLPERNIRFFWFMAGAYFVNALTTKGCCWWASDGKMLPTWAGRVALVVVACGWIIAGTRFSN